MFGDVLSDDVCCYWSFKEHKATSALNVNPTTQVERN